jgi:hypothetical protein
MTLRLNGSTSGYTEIDAPAVAGNNTLVLPSGNGASGQVLTTNGSGALNWTSDVMLSLGTASTPSLFFLGNTNTGMWSPGADTIAWSTAGFERARINNIGSAVFGKTSTSETVTGVVISGPTGQVIASSPDGADAGVFYRSTTGAGNGVILTKSNVGGTNSLVGAGFANGTFGAISDATKKKNVEPSRDYLSDVMLLRVVKYNWKTDDDGAPKELGWIAQEVEQVFPGMVSELDGSKLLKKEVFLPMLMKCIQEQQVVIQNLESRIAALEVTP